MKIWIYMDREINFFMFHCHREKYFLLQRIKIWIFYNLKLSCIYTKEYILEKFQESDIPQ